MREDRRRSEKNNNTQPEASVESSVKQTESQQQTESSSEKEDELEPYTLKMWMPVKEIEDSDMVEDTVNEHLKDVLPNTTVEFEWMDTAEYAERWPKEMAAGEVVDVAWFGWILKMGNEVAMGSLTPLDDLMAEYGRNTLCKTYDNFEELYEEYYKKMDEAGLDKVFEEVVKQLEVYVQKMGLKVKVVDLDAL